MMRLPSKSIGRVIGSLLFFLWLAGCGFHLRGAFNIPPALQVLKIEPDQPYEPFQRILKQILKQNGITVVDCGLNDTVPSLQLSDINFSEKPVAYGSDVQVNRSTLRFTVSYEVLDTNCNVLVSKQNLDVERDLTIVPTSVLGTESERNHVKTELYNDAATLLIRQLSLPCPR